MKHLEHIRGFVYDGDYASAFLAISEATGEDWRLGLSYIFDHPIRVNGASKGYGSGDGEPSQSGFYDGDGQGCGGAYISQENDTDEYVFQGGHGCGGSTGVGGFGNGVGKRASGLGGGAYGVAAADRKGRARMNDDWEQ